MGYNDKMIDYPRLSDDHRDNRMAELQADYNDLEGQLVALREKVELMWRDYMERMS